MDWLGNNVKTFKVKGITIIANRNNGMVIGLDREGEEVVDLLKSNLIEISSLSDNQKERKRLNFRHGYKNPRPHFCNRSTLIIHI